jgi:hypothetical protein
MQVQCSKCSELLALSNAIESSDGRLSHMDCKRPRMLIAETCPQCSRMISPDDTIVFGHGLLGHLDCRRPRVLSGEERTLLLVYCRDHQVAECVRCAGKFRLGEVASLDQFGIRSHGCPWCHTDLTDSIRAHLYSCAMLPVEVRRRAQAVREATRSLVQSFQSRGTADGLERQAEASLHALRETMRKAPARSATSENKQIRLLSYHVFPRHLQVGDRFSDETGEWEVAGRPYSTAGGKSINASVRRVDQPATVKERTWVAHERIRVRVPRQEPQTRST